MWSGWNSGSFRHNLPVLPRDTFSTLRMSMVKKECRQREKLRAQLLCWQGECIKYCVPTQTVLVECINTAWYLLIYLVIKSYSLVGMFLEYVNLWEAFYIFFRSPGMQKKAAIEKYNLMELPCSREDLVNMNSLHSKQNGKEKDSPSSRHLVSGRVRNRSWFLVIGIWQYR